MRWTSVTWAVCVLPVLTGCGALRNGSSDESGLHLARRGAGTEAEFRRDAQVAWDGLCARHSHRAFSDEFRDGFVDGYAEFCDRGAGCEAPPVPPVPYARYKKFFGRGGSHLVRDYYVGFQHGADTAAGPPATEPAPRARPPKPADMPPPKPPATGKFGEPRKSGSDESPPLAPPPGDAPKPIPPLPKPELPVIKPFNPDLSGSKFAPVAVPADPERVPPPFPALPVAEALAVPLVVPDDAPKVGIPPLSGPLPVPTPVYKVPLSAAPNPLDPIPPIPLRYPPK